jgi:hypothetical protein
MRHGNRAALALLFCAGWTGSAFAGESYDSCTGFIDALPASITAPGTWCLRKDLVLKRASGIAVWIKADDVTLDCNGNTLDGSYGGAGTIADGIYGSDRHGITVRHCEVRGFEYGLRLSGDDGGMHVVEDNRFGDNTHMAIYVAGDGSTVRRNQVLDTGASTVAADAIAEGIAARMSVDIIDNTVSGVAGATSGVGSAYGIYTRFNDGGTIAGNRIRGLVAGGSGVVRGIDNVDSGRVVVDGNNVVGDDGAGSIGIRCSTDRGRARDNVTLGFGTGIAACGDSGGNVGDN